MHPHLALADPSWPYADTGGTSGMGRLQLFSLGVQIISKCPAEFEEERFTRAVLMKSGARRLRDEEALALGASGAGAGKGRSASAGALEAKFVAGFVDLLKSIGRDGVVVSGTTEERQDVMESSQGSDDV